MKHRLYLLSLIAGLLGFALLVTGLALWSVPAALVTAGACLLAYARLLDRASAAIKPGG